MSVSEPLDDVQRSNLFGTCRCGRAVRYTHLQSGEGHCGKRGCDDDLSQPPSSSAAQTVPATPLPLLLAKVEYDKLLAGLDGVDDWTPLEHNRSWTFFWHGWRARTGEALHQQLAELGPDVRAELEALVMAL